MDFFGNLLEILNKFNFWQYVKVFLSVDRKVEFCITSIHIKLLLKNKIMWIFTENTHTNTCPSNEAIITLTLITTFSVVAITINTANMGVVQAFIMVWKDLILFMCKMFANQLLRKYK